MTSSPEFLNMSGRIENAANTIDLFFGSTTMSTMFILKTGLQSFCHAIVVQHGFFTAIEVVTQASNTVP